MKALELKLPYKAERDYLPATFYCYACGLSVSFDSIVWLTIWPGKNPLVYPARARQSSICASVRDDQTSWTPNTDTFLALKHNSRRYDLSPVTEEHHRHASCGGRDFWKGNTFSRMHDSRFESVCLSIFDNWQNFESVCQCINDPFRNTWKTTILPSISIFGSLCWTTIKKATARRIKTG